MQELGQLQGEDAKKLEELKTLTTSLGEKRAEIDEKLSIISSRPEVQEKLYDAAKKEDVGRDVEKITTEARRELEPRIDKMTNDIRSYAQNLEYSERAWRRRAKQLMPFGKRLGKPSIKPEKWLAKNQNCRTYSEKIYVRRKPSPN